MIDSIIFDLDGTLWDSTGQVPAAWNQVLEGRSDVAFRASKRNLRQLFGLPLPVIASIIFPELPRKEQLALMDACCESEHQYLLRHPGTLFPGVRETLPALAQRYPLYIVSNCEGGYIEVFLEATGLAPYFRGHLCPGDTGLYKAENLRRLAQEHQLSCPVYLGDTAGDEEACREACIPFLFASYGFGKPYSYSDIVPDFAALPGILSRLDSRLEGQVRVPGASPSIFQRFNPAVWERREHYFYYMNQIKTRYNLNVQLDITDLLQAVRAQHLHFFPAMLYLVMRCVNETKEYRTSPDREGVPGFWNYCHPSYTVFHEDDHTFSDIWSPYSPDFRSFYSGVLADIAAFGSVKGVKAKEGRPDNFIPVSSLPWLSFSGHGCDTFTESPMILPILLFGKYYEQDGRWYLPFSVSVNHAAADGYHSAAFLNRLQELCRQAGEFLR